MLWLGVDVGGTFTDLVLFDVAAGKLQVLKTPSTPRNQSEGILAGIARLGVEARKLGRMVHGTTVATNTALERDGARLAVLVTAGHKDVLVVGRGNRMAMYNIKAPPIRPLVPRSQCIEVQERLRVDGSVVRPLDETEVDAIAEPAGGGGRRGGGDLLPALLRQSRAREDDARRSSPSGFPTATVTTSAEVLPEFREYERFSTTALNAYVAPRMRRYLGDLRGKLEEAGMSAPLAIMTSNGGSLPAPRVEAMPVLSMLSGTGSGRDRGRPCRVCGRLSRSHHVRHGRHVDRRVPGARRHVRHDDGRPRRRVSDQDPADRHQFDRRRRGQHRRARHRRLSHGRSAIGRRGARPRLLRPRRHRADHHRRQRGAGTPRRRPAARRRDRARPRGSAGRHHGTGARRSASVAWRWRKAFCALPPSRWPARSRRCR